MAEETSQLPHPLWRQHSGPTSGSEFTMSPQKEGQPANIEVNSGYGHASINIPTASDGIRENGDFTYNWTNECRQRSIRRDQLEEGENTLSRVRSKPAVVNSETESFEDAKLAPQPLPLSDGGFLQNDAESNLMMSKISGELDLGSSTHQEGTQSRKPNSIERENLQGFDSAAIRINKIDSFGNIDEHTGNARHGFAEFVVNKPIPAAIQAKIAGERA